MYHYTQEDYWVNSTGSIASRDQERYNKALINAFVDEHEQIYYCSQKCEKTLLYLKWQGRILKI